MPSTFPSLIDQFNNPPSERILLDRTILKTIGIKEKEIDSVLDELYEILNRTK
jgi:hypothetical protein